MTTADDQNDNINRTRLRASPGQNLSETGPAQGSKINFGIIAKGHNIQTYEQLKETDVEDPK